MNVVFKPFQIPNASKTGTVMCVGETTAYIKRHFDGEEWAYYYDELSPAPKPKKKLYLWAYRRTIDGQWLLSKAFSSYPVASGAIRLDWSMIEVDS